MKTTAVVLMSFLVAACTGTGHYDADDFQLIELKGAIDKLIDMPMNGSRIDNRWWPEQIRELEPESVMKSDKGIHIRLDSFFVEESGLFVPLPGSTFEPGEHADPSYRLLGEGIYSYHVTG